MLKAVLEDVDLTQHMNDALKSLGADAARTLEASIAALEQIGDQNWFTETIQGVLQTALIERLELKPRLAFGPLRVAASGRRVSPPLFESFELLGRDETLARLKKLVAYLADHSA